MYRPAFLIQHFFPYAKGATYSAWQLAQGLELLGSKPIFIVNDYDGRYQGGKDYAGFSVHGFRYVGAGKIRNAAGLIQILWFLWKKRKQIDILHVHGGSFNNLLVAWCVRKMGWFKILLKMTLIGYDTPDAIRAGRHGRLASHFFAGLHGAIAMTSGQRNLLQKSRFRGVYAVIPNAVDVERFQPTSCHTRKKFRGSMNIAVDAEVILLVGSISRRKGIDILLQFFLRIAKDRDRVRLILVGDYGDRDKISRLYDAAVGVDKETLDGLLGGRITIVGEVSDVEKYYQAADLFVFPSRQEGFGTVQIEAMASGLPCVANYIEGVTDDIFPDETVGRVVRDNNVDEYVRIIDDLLSNPMKRKAIGEAARTYAENHYSVDAVSNRYLAFYGELFAPK